jgi:methyl-accepting chemotaxis protein
MLGRGLLMHGFGRHVRRLAAKLSLSIRGKMIATGFVSVGAVLLLSVLHFQLGWAVSDQMSESDHFRQVRDNLVKMRMAVLETDSVVNQAVARRGDFYQSNIQMLGIARKDFEDGYKNAAGFVREDGAALGGRDAAQEFAELVRRLDEEIKPALKNDDFMALPVAMGVFEAKIQMLDEMLEGSAQRAAGEMSRHFKSTANEIRWAASTNVVTSIVSLVILISLLIVSTVSILRPLKLLTRSMQILAQGNTEVAIPARQRRDEIGAMASTVEVFRANTEKMHALEQEREETQQRAAQERKQMMTDLAARFDAGMRGLIEAITSESGRLRDLAAAMAAVADATQQKGAEASDASQLSTGNVKAVAASSEELSSSLKEVAQQIERSAGIAKKAVSDVEATSRDVEGVAATAARINDVVKLIGEIASQTNLLALNATIEAARAGDAGKGFAVVASEVKNLATQAAKATEDITQQIAALHSVVSRSVRSMTDVRSVIAEADAIASAVAAAIAQQTAATHEIAQNVAQAADGNERVFATIQLLADSAREGQQTADAVHEASQTLTEASARLDRDIHAFLNQIRAA